MAKELVPASLDIPAYVLARMKGAPTSIGAAVGGGIAEGIGYSRISIKASKFRTIDEDGTEVVLNALVLPSVIIGANPGVSKKYYAEAWDSDSEPEAPTCQSLSGITPDADVTLPQSDRCATCPQNAWGSRVTKKGKQAKECSDQKRLAVVAADNPTGPVYLLSVPATSLKNVKAYWKTLASRGLSLELVRTDVTFDPDASYPKLVFAFGGFLDEEAMAAVDTRLSDPIVAKITGEDAPHVAPALAVEEPAESPAESPAEEPATKASGFGGAAKTKPKAKAKAKTKPKESGFGAAAEEEVKPAPMEEPEQAQAIDASTDDLASDIADLVAGMADDA